MKLLCATALTAALMTAAVMSITSPAQAQALAGWGWGWPRLVTAGTGAGNIYADCDPTPCYGPLAPTYSYTTAWSYPGYGQYQPYSSNPWYRAAHHPFIRRHVPLWARAAGARRHWQ
jgi:hypothetical protein